MHTLYKKEKFGVDISVKKYKFVNRIKKVLICLVKD